MGAINETIIAVTQEMIIPTIKEIAAQETLSPLGKLIFTVGFFAILIGILNYGTKIISITATSIAYFIGTIKYIINKIKGKQI